MKKAKKLPSPVTKGHIKVPVIMQMEFLECGAASLSMILAYYGKWLPLEQVRSDCGVSRDGTNAKNLLTAARSYGLFAKAYIHNNESIREKGIFPCIIHWNNNHFVVLNGFSKNHAYINDPARGSLKLTAAEFDKSFSGMAIFLHPEESFEQGGKPHSVVSFALKRTKGTLSSALFIMASALAAILIGILQPAFSRVFMDRLLTGKDPEWLYPFTLGLLVLAFIGLAADSLKSLQMLKIEGKLAIVSSSKFMWHVLRMPMGFFSQRMAGDIASRQKNNETVASELMRTFAPLALDLVMMLFYLAVMLRYSVMLTAIGVLAMIINMAVAKITSAKKVNVTRVQMRNSGRLTGMTVNGIEMIETIKASGAENGFFEKWAGYHAAVNTQTVKFTKISQYLGVLPELISNITNIIILVAGVFLTMQGQFTIGMILAFQGFVKSFQAPASKLMRASQKLQETRTNMERIEDIENYPIDEVFSSKEQDSAEKDSSDSSDSDDGDTFAKLSGNVEIKNITFGYSRLGKPLIEDFSLSLKTGSRVALVGASGCGKSTVSKLVSGLYQPWSGEILFDGKEIKDIRREVFTGSLAVVDQDIILFEDTIANNIKMWDSSIEDFEMIMAANDAQIHKDITQRNGGYQYRITEGGKDFSGGQRQRIEIARALAQDPTIIIMDEATSALDAKTEYEVVNAIKNRGITCIVVAHRLSTIRDCDEIIVMDKGRIVERGTHEELFKNDGLYTKLVTSE